MHAWEAIQRSIDYIEENLTEEIGLGQLAAVAGLSPFYFQRLFARLVKRPFREYVKLRRLARAAEDLKGGARILDTAVKYGFSSHGNFTRAFKETYGITPDEYKKTRPMLNSFIKPEISVNYVMTDEDVPLVAGDIVLEIGRRVLDTAEVYLGFAADVKTASQIPAGESTGIDIPGELWNKFHKQKNLLCESFDPYVEMGMSYNPREGAFTYFAGGLLTPAGELEMELEMQQAKTGPMTRRQLAEGEYLVCSVEAETFESLVTSALDQAGKYFFGKWLPAHQLTTLPFSAEKYDFSTEGVNRLEIWVSPAEIKA